jgi:copper homeostasis protein
VRRRSRSKPRAARIARLRCNGAAESLPILLEVIVQTVADAREATDGGADRLEVVRDILTGGLTPPVSLVRAIAAQTPLPIRVMVRENSGYATGARERPALRRAAAEFHALGVDGIVIGFARDGRPALDDLADVLDAAPGVRATFHRAFDQLQDPLGAIDELARVPQIDRILTDAGGRTARSRCRALRAYTARAAGRMEILAGGGVDADAFALFARTKCVREIHVGTAVRLGNDLNGPVSAARVRRLRTLAD